MGGMGPGAAAERCVTLGAAAVALMQVRGEKGI